LEALLIKAGFYKKGEEIYMSGITGMRYEAPIFVGVCQYQKLKHMVDGRFLLVLNILFETHFLLDKIHTRFKGPVHIKTRQPVDGRCRDGGLRFGEVFEEI
jgi:DNA-directed RNA polymerase beta subunit